MGFVDFGTRNDTKESAERIRGCTMKRLLSTLIFLFCLCVILQIGAPVAFSAAPVLFFSDLTWGPKTGWEGSQTKGAAVTIWGKNFGSTRGSNYVTVNGAQITEYA
jgi:hypothetical protein